MGTSMNNRFSLAHAICAALAVCMLAAASPAQALEERDAAKAILKNCGDSVIAVKATIKLRVVVGGSERLKDENEIETLATVIDPSGLSVLSFSCIDPTRMFDGIMRKLKAAGQGADTDVSSDITGITMVLPDGREIPAKVVLRDGDLDLAFIRPEEKLDKPLAALDITSESKLDVLDTVCIIGRLDKLAGRGPTISLQRIEAVISSPRRCYVAETDALMGKLGAPVFSLDGKVAGFSLLRMSRPADKQQRLNFLSNGIDALGIMPVILPAGEVFEIAKQAQEPKEH